MAQEVVDDIVSPSLSLRWLPYVDPASIQWMFELIPFLFQEDEQQSLRNKTTDLVLFLQRKQFPDVYSRLLARSKLDRSYITDRFCKFIGVVVVEPTNTVLLVGCLGWTDRTDTNSFCPIHANCKGWRSELEMKFWRAQWKLSLECFINFLQDNPNSSSLPNFLDWLGQSSTHAKLQSILRFPNLISSSPLSVREQVLPTYREAQEEAEGIHPDHLDMLPYIQSNMKWLCD